MLVSRKRLDVVEFFSNQIAGQLWLILDTEPKTRLLEFIELHFSRRTPLQLSYKAN